ncbi:MAG: sulfatase-like hydrolase/transferase [Myxococcales bacterium]|nr:sulfatase-like hydrolase/transferase [Myxococcales bacterium]
MDAAALQTPEAPRIELGALFAALVLSAAELWLLRDQPHGPRLALLAAFVLLFSAAALALLLRLGLAATRALRARPTLRAAAGAALLSPLCVWLSVKLFSGTGISQHAIASWGPYASSALLCGFSFGALRLLPRLRQALLARSTPLRLALAPLPLLFAAGLLWIDHVVYPHHYLYLHWMLLLGAALSLIAAVWLVVALRELAIWQWVAPLLLVASVPGFVAAAAIGLATNAERQALMTHTLGAGRLVALYQTLLDRDGDGHSVIFGERDCDNGNANVHPFAADTPGNGIDEDCDGHDARPRARAPRAVDAARYRQLLSAWRARPGVAAKLSRYAQMNIVLIVIDALRADQLRDTRANRENHPTLMKLVSRSVRFERAFSSGAGTDVGMGAIFTGALEPLRGKHTSLPRALRQAGMTTHGIFQREVDRWAVKKLELDGLETRHVVINDSQRRDVSLETTSEAVSDAALRFLRSKRASAKPFFLWAHYFDVHEHLDVSREALRGGKWLARGMQFYRALLAHTDKQIRRLLRAIERRRAARETIIVLLGDHGEGLQRASDGRKSDRLPRTHGARLYNELTHVPLAVYIPGLAPRRIARPVSLVDVYPTLLELAGAGASGDARRSFGVSLAPFLLHGDDRRALGDLARLARALVLNESEQRAIIAWPFKLIAWWDRSVLELYDLSRDFAEQRDLSDARPRLARRLMARLARLSLHRIRRGGEPRKVPSKAR